MIQEYEQAEFPQIIKKQSQTIRYFRASCCKRYHDTNTQQKYHNKIALGTIRFNNGNSQRTKISPYFDKVQ